MKRKNKGKIRWQTLVYVFPCWDPFPTLVAKNGRYSFHSLFCGQGWPCVPQDDLRKRLQDRREGVRVIFLPDHGRNVSDECLFLFPSCLEQLQWFILWPWGKAQENHGNADPKPWCGELLWTNSRPAQLTLLHEENKSTLTNPLIVRWAIACRQNLTQYRWRRPFSLANEINLKVLPPLMASTMIFIKDLKYLCFIYIV